MPAKNSRNGCTAQAENAITSFKDRDAFLRAMLADVELSTTARILTARLALHHDVETGRCIVKYKTLAKEVGVCSRTAIRLLAEAEERGWVSIDRTCGRGQSNNFLLIIPAEKVTSECHLNEPDAVPEKVTNRVVKGDKSGGMSAEKVTSGVTPKSLSRV
jgi:hypothetical protein